MHFIATEIIAGNGLAERLFVLVVKTSEVLSDVLLAFPFGDVLKVDPHDSTH